MYKLHYLTVSQFLIICISLFLYNAQAQYIKLDNKFVISSFYNDKNLPILSDKVNSYSVQLGTEYLQKRWFYLSSQMGYLKLGGKETNVLLQGENEKVLENRSYVHFNTTFRPYVDLSGLKVFFGVGPYVNILTGTKKFNSSLYSSNYNFKNLSGGGKIELGVSQDINRFRLEVLVDYLHNISGSADSPSITLNNNALSGAFSIGYRIQNEK